MNGKYTLHNKYEIYNDCIYIKWFDEVKQIVDEPHIVSKSFILLRGVPDEFYHVEIENMIEVKNKTILEKNEYQVDYKYGLIRFNENLDRELIVVKEYYSRGEYYFPANRIYYKINPIDGTVVTMYDILDKIQDELRFEQKNAKEIHKILSETIENAKVTDKDLRDAIALAKKLILELGIDQYVKWKDVGNDKKIPLSNKELNVNLNADLLDGKHAEEFANKEHIHTKKDIIDFPEKLPADGGNADTIDGKSPDYFAKKEHIHYKKDIIDLKIGKAGVSNNYNDLDNKPTKLPADGGNADTLQGRYATNFIENKSKYTINATYVPGDSIHFGTSTNSSEYVEKAKFADKCLHAINVGDINKDNVMTKNSQIVDIYVSKDGNDDNDGSRNKPFLTIQRAIDALPDYCNLCITIHLGDGWYNENLDFRGKFIAHKLIITGNGTDRTKVNLGGTIRGAINYGEFKILNMRFVPNYNFIKDYIVRDSNGKTIFSIIRLDICRYPTLENIEIVGNNISVDYYYPIYINCSEARVKSVKIRNTHGKIRGTGIFSDNGSDVYCWNNDINGTEICYYTQGATIRVYSPITPSISDKDYNYLSKADVKGVVID